MVEKFELKDIVLIGRIFEEYYKMFQMDRIDKDEKILDVASGVSSFCAEANLNGYNVMASDKIYRFSPFEIEEKCAHDLDIVIEELQDVKEHYKWEFFKNMNSYKEIRKTAYKKFINDFKEKKHHRYVDTEFPETKFKNNQFTISLVSHFLFLYDEHLSYEFHNKTIKELIRITSDEIRIFPIVNLRWKTSPFVSVLMEDPEFANHDITIQKVDYEFVKNGNEMLKLKIESN